MRKDLLSKIIYTAYVLGIIPMLVGCYIGMTTIGDIEGQNLGGKVIILGISFEVFILIFDLLRDIWFKK
jgi:ABC-type transporter Mla maintaining outer membrane lipid asymmetry permease subunit MlaE